MSEQSAAPVEPVTRTLRGGVLSIGAFRRLWLALGLSSLGDWLGLLALTALAQSLSGGDYTTANVATATVFILRLAPAVIFGPFAGVVADRLDRRITMVVCDILRFALFASIPFVATYWYLFLATFLIEVLSLFWIPAKDATVPNLVPRERLEQANQLSLFVTYGSAPVAALLFAALSLLTGVLDNAFAALKANPVDLALWVNAVTFLVSAATIYTLRDIRTPERVAGERVALRRTLVEGWSFVSRTPAIRGLVVGMLGATAAGGAVIGLARTYVEDLGAGNPGYGALFGAVFVGLAGGMGGGPRLLSTLSRRRMFGLAITAAGLTLALLAMLPNIVLAVLLAVVVGACTGVAWVSGYTLLGLEVDDAVRGRTFAFVQSLVRVVLVAVLAVAPLLAAAFGRHTIEFTETQRLTYNGAAITYLLAGLLAAAVGIVSFRQMDDRRGLPLRHDLVAAWRGEQLPGPGESATGYFLAIEGGDGAGKSSLAEALAGRLRDAGHEVVRTHEPGATPMGRRLRDLLLDRESAAMSARTEALLYAADRAEHVETVVRPALERAAVVLTDRYLDSSVAYQGAGRQLSAEEIRRLSRWATEGLVPHLTVLLDVEPALGLGRGGAAPDRLESEPLDFHTRVREGFLAQARRYPQRYLVVDAGLPREEVLDLVCRRLAGVLPMTAAGRAQQQAERGDADNEAALRAERAAARAGQREQQAAARHAAAAARSQRRAEQRAQRSARRDAVRQAAQAAVEQRAVADEEARRARALVATQRATAAQRAAQERAIAAAARDRAAWADAQRAAAERAAAERAAAERAAAERESAERESAERQTAQRAAAERAASERAARQAALPRQSSETSGSTPDLADEIFTAFGVPEEALRSDADTVDLRGPKRKRRRQPAPEDGGRVDVTSVDIEGSGDRPDLRQP